MRRSFLIGAGLPLILVAVAIFYRSQSTPEVSAYLELVLPEHTTLLAETPAGPIEVVSGVGLERWYGWAGCRLKVTMVPLSSRWYGSLGAVESSTTIFGDLFSRSCDGISRAVVGEGQIHFADLEWAEKWAERYRVTCPASVRTHDGLLVAWSLTPARNQINVNVWQICIDGQPPRNMPRSATGAISLTSKGENILPLPCRAVPPEVSFDTQAAWQKNWDQAEAWTNSLRAKSERGR